MTQQTQPKRFIKRLLGSKIFLFFIILILIVLVVNLFRESYRKYQLTKEINKLKSEIERLEGKSQYLADVMEHFQEGSYLEKEARLKLNLKKPEEKVVVLSQREREEDIQGDLKMRLEEARKSQRDENNETANYWKWWEYFFALK